MSDFHQVCLTEGEYNRQVLPGGLKLGIVKGRKEGSMEGRKEGIVFVKFPSSVPNRWRA